MHDLKRRNLKVLRTELVAPRMQRITLGGEELAGFASLAPGDHVKIFFPDTPGGMIHAPTLIDGRPQQPEGTVIARDYTPFAFRAEGQNGPELDIDFVLHGDTGAQGPASEWAAKAKPGDPLIVAGPRGSIVPPEDVSELLLIADETALPAVTRWLDLYPDTPATGIFSVSDVATADYLFEYKKPGRTCEWISGEDRDDRVLTALREATITQRTLVFLAGEATSLIPLRRYLRRELGLSKQQVDAHGYWKRGVVNLDHHAPLDPSDPDD